MRIVKNQVIKYAVMGITFSQIPLARAEMLRAPGRKHVWNPVYDEAIASAQQNGYVQNQAIAQNYQFMRRKAGRNCKGMVGDAYRLYSEWGTYKGST